MRKADFDTAWEECRKSNLATISISSLQFSTTEEPTKIDVSSRIIGFIGSNGAGKTGIFKSIVSLIFGSTTGTARFQAKSIDGSFHGHPFKIETKNAHPKGFFAEFIDVSAEVHRILNFIKKQQNFDELLAQFDPNTPNISTQGLYKHITRLPYSKITIREIEAPQEPSIEEKSDESSDDAIFPFFEITAGSLNYNCLSMGFGEFCACYLVWKLNRASKGSMLLLDEPDSHLSPKGRSALADAIAYISHERKLWVAFTTHSIELIDQLKLREIFLVTSDTFRAHPTINPLQHRRQVIRELGLSQQRTLLIAVEDIDSRTAVWLMVNKWGNPISSSLDIAIVADGAEKVRDFIGHFPTETRICQAVAVLDGDKKSTNQNDTPGRILYLPGVQDPIAEARNAVNSNPIELARRLNIPVEVLEISLKKCEHVDHHDFLSELLAEINLEGQTVQDIRLAVLGLWIELPQISEEGKILVEHLGARLE